MGLHSFSYCDKKKTHQYPQGVDELQHLWWFDYIIFVYQNIQRKWHLVEDKIVISNYQFVHIMSAAWGQKTTKHTQQSMKYLLRLKVMEKSIYAQIVILFIFLAKFIHLYRNCAKCRHIHFMSHYTDLILETNSPEINAFSWGKKHSVIQSEKPFACTIR